MYWFTNATQPIALTLPVLSSRHGYAKAQSALIDAYKSLAEPAGSLAVTELKRLLRGRSPLLRSSSVAEHFASRLGPDEKAMINRLIELNRLDITMAVEINQLAMRGAEKRGFTTVMNDWLVAAPHVVEVINRMTTALAAYRLARAEGRSHDDATQYAADSVFRTQLD
ncbi:MAG: hypothetical protein N2544_18055, partial [Burkholderiales bacterium]|nr:hypothetical protein [Burkholderiales bacterium]